MNELYLYTQIDSYSSERAVKYINGIDEDSEMKVRINCPGGSVNSGWALISKLSEFEGKKIGVVDGQASSMAAILLLFMDEVIANDTSRIMFHKAAFPAWYTATEEDKAELDSINGQFEAKLTKKVDGKPGAKKFIKDVFGEGRKDVYLTPTQAQKLGIVSEIRNIEVKAEMMNMDIVAMFEEPENNVDENNVNKNKMTEEEKKIARDKAYAEGQEAGAKAERERINTWLVFANLDEAGVKAGIESGEPLAESKRSEYLLKAQDVNALKDLEKESPKDTKTRDGEETPEKKAEREKEVQAKRNALLDKMTTGITL